MKTIWKYPLGPKQRVSAAWTPVFVGRDPYGIPHIWAEVDTEADLQHELSIDMVGTGTPIDPAMTYAGSFLDGPFVWHVYCATRSVRNNHD